MAKTQADINQALIKFIASLANDPWVHNKVSTYASRFLKEIGYGNNDSANSDPRNPAPQGEAD